MTKEVVADESFSRSVTPVCTFSSQKEILTRYSQTALGNKRQSSVFDLARSNSLWSAVLSDVERGINYPSVQG